VEVAQAVAREVTALGAATHLIKRRAEVA